MQDIIIKLAVFGINVQFKPGSEHLATVTSDLENDATKTAIHALIISLIKNDNDIETANVYAIIETMVKDLENQVVPDTEVSEAKDEERYIYVSRTRKVDCLAKEETTFRVDKDTWNKHLELEKEFNDDHGDDYVTATMQSIRDSKDDYNKWSIVKSEAEIDDLNEEFDVEYSLS